MALLRSAAALHGFKGEDDDQQIGINIVGRAIESPLRWIAQNAGQEGAIVAERIRNSDDDNFGYNAATDTYGDLVAQGVIDPVKVTRTALQNAASISSLMLTTEATVHEIPEKTPPSASRPARRRRLLGAR